MNVGVENTSDGLLLDSLDLPTGHPFVMKIDIEGNALDALVGANDFLKHADIVVVMMELTPDQLKKDKFLWKNYFDIFVSKGLEPYRFELSGTTTKLDGNKFLTWTGIRGYADNAFFNVLWKKKE